MISHFYIILIITLLIPNDDLYLYKKPLNQSMGRDKDPTLLTDISKFKLWNRKVLWTTLSAPGMRFMAKLIFPKSTISYLDIDEMVVAFTVDDGFCGADNPGGDMTKEVRELFKKYDAQATFFVTGNHCMHTDKENIEKLLQDGHELANHGMYDRSYNNYSEQEFIDDFERTEIILKQYTDRIPKWYRAPRAKLSKTMQRVLDDRGYTHVMCDGFANDTKIPDSQWISKYILKRVKAGSIILIHMPEKGVREWNYQAMELTLKGLKEKGYQIVTFSKLYELAQSKR